MHVRADFVADYEAILRSELEGAGYKVSPDADVLLLYFNVLRRMVHPRPRTIHEAPSLECPRECEEGYELLKEKVRYFGVFANHHSLRERIRPEHGAPPAVAPTQVPLFDVTGLRPWDAAAMSKPIPRDRARLGWASLLARAFAIDISVCRRCGGHVRVIAAITDPDEIATLRPLAQDAPSNALSA